MSICDCCNTRLAMHQVTFPDQMVAFVCDGCLPEGDVIHRVDFITDDFIDAEIGAMLA